MVAEVIELILNIIQLALYTAQIAEVASRAGSSNSSRTSSSDLNRRRRTLGQSLPSAQHPRAVLIASSAITFGNACERLVNIAFDTSRAFPMMMGTYGAVDQYLRKELAKQYADEYFHIVIGENQAFGFSVDDSEYFAEIEQEQYRVLIFSTKRNSNSKLDTHDANSQVSFLWK